MTEEERAEWESDRAKAAAELFEEFDKNHDGVLDEGEQMMMARLLAEGDAGDRKALVDKLHEADHNHDGKLGAPLDCRAACLHTSAHSRPPNADASELTEAIDDGNANLDKGEMLLVEHAWPEDDDDLE